MILKGEVQILKATVIKEKKMTAEQYFFYLDDQIRLGQEELVRIIIKENYNIYPININDITNLKDIIFMVRYRKSIYSLEELSSNQLNELFLQFNKDPFQEINLDLKIEIPNEKLRRSSITYLKDTVKSYNVSSYLYLENSQMKTVKCYFYENFLTLTTGDFFGDYGLENKTHTRTATIKAKEDCFLGIIDIKQYLELIYAEKQKIAIKDQLFILEHFLFKNISHNVFKLKYFANFICCKFIKDEYLFKQLSDLDYVYFILEGEISLSISNINFKEINVLIKNLCEKMKITDEIVSIIILYT